MPNRLPLIVSIETHVRYTSRRSHRLSVVGVHNVWFTATIPADLCLEATAAVLNMSDATSDQGTPC